MTADNYADTEANFVCDRYIRTGFPMPTRVRATITATDSLDRQTAPHARSCKAEPPSEGKVLANVMKERQNTVHEALADAVDEAKAVYERMKVRVCLVCGWIDR